MQYNFVLQVKSQDTLLPPPHGQLAPCLVAPRLRLRRSLRALNNFITDNFKIVSLSGSHTILYFSIANIYADIQTGEGTHAPNDEVECRWYRQKSRFSTNICLHRVMSTVQPRNDVHTATPDRGRRRGKLLTLIAGKRRRLLFAGDGRRSVYDEKPQRYQRYAEDNRTEFNCTQL